MELFTYGEFRTHIERKTSLTHIATCLFPCIRTWFAHYIRDTAKTGQYWSEFVFPFPMFRGYPLRLEDAKHRCHPFGDLANITILRVLVILGVIFLLFIILIILIRFVVE